jgi:lauroyl/myristoyl acyltransferase
MTTRFGRLADWTYFFALLPLLAVVPRRWREYLLVLLARYLSSSCIFHREETRSSLKSVLPDLGYSKNQIDDQVVLSFKTMLAEDLDAYYFPLWNLDKVRHHNELEGSQFLDEALSRRKGALLFTAHIGSPCALPVLLGLKGYPINHLTRDSGKERGLPAPFRIFSRFKLRWLKKASRRDLTFISQESYAHSSVDA